MSDYMFMLESHLSTDQNRVVSEVQSVAAQNNVSLFLTGGAMRDMLGSFPIRDLDFTVESASAVKLARLVAKHTGATVLSEDDHRKVAELSFPGGVSASIGMARRETFSKPGARPHVAPATIHEDLGCRDFTVNAIALSLNRASRGLLLDPTNGLGDLERKELRTAYNYALYDDPGRLLRLIRFKVRLGFIVQEKTQSQYDNVRAEQLEQRIPARRLFEELRSMADESQAGEILETLSKENLLGLFSTALAGPKLNLAGMARLQKAHQLIPAGVRLPVEGLGLFLSILTEKLTPKERTALIEATAMEKEEVDLWQKLDARTKKLEKELSGPRLSRPAQVYQALSKAPGDHVLHLYLHSTSRLVQDRIRNYLQKYLPMAQEITDDDVRAKGAEPGTPKFQKVRDELIAAHLNARPKKPVEEPEPAKPPEPAFPPGRRPLRQPIVRG